MTRSLHRGLGPALFSALALAACSGGQDRVAQEASPGADSAPAAAPGQSNGAGATFPNPIYAKWFAEYNQSHPEVRINYQSIGRGGGVRQLPHRRVFFRSS